MGNTIRIEKTTEAGYETKDYSYEDALNVLNLELENERTLWIDGRPFLEEVITEEDLKKCKKEISVTNRLIGG